MEELNRYLSNLSEHHDMYVMQILPTIKVAAAGYRRNANDRDRSGRESDQDKVEKDDVHWSGKAMLWKVLFSDGVYINVFLHEESIEKTILEGSQHYSRLSRNESLPMLRIFLHRDIARIFISYHNLDSPPSNNRVYNCLRVEIQSLEVARSNMRNQSERS